MTRLVRNKKLLLGRNSNQTQRSLIILGRISEGPLMYFNRSFKIQYDLIKLRNLLIGQIKMHVFIECMSVHVTLLRSRISLDWQRL